MTLHLTPAFGPPPPTSQPAPTYSFEQKVEAAANTIELLAGHGMELRWTSDDVETAGAYIKQYAEDPAKAGKALTIKRIGTMTHPALRAIDRQLKIFSETVVEDAAQVRTYVTNKLLEETENPDPRIRMKALELLGKISDVGLFAERSEVTVTHQTSDDLREALRQKLTKLVNPETIEDAEVVDEPPAYLDAEELDAAWDDDDE